MFVLTFNSNNGTPVITPHMHADVRIESTDYQIIIPKNHPSGLFWFHPHAHGLALNQVSAGMSGLITEGDITEYICNGRNCGSFVKNVRIRHIMLKDTQLLSGGSLQDQEDPDFSAQYPSKGEDRQGSCTGQNNSDDDGSDYRGGRWFFTLNGQSYPTFPVKSSPGEIWRITNASGSVTYDLGLFNQKLGEDMILQILSLDGVGVKPTSGMSAQATSEIAGKLPRVDAP